MYNWYIFKLLTFHKKSKIILPFNKQLDPLFHCLELAIIWEFTKENFMVMCLHTTNIYDKINYAILINTDYDRGEL